MAPVTPETLVLAVAYLGLFVGVYLVLDELHRRVGADEPADDPDAESAPETVVCPSCGGENGGGYLYCRHCTTQLGSAA